MILCITGGLGSGKTLLMSALAVQQMALGRVVAANYALHGARIFTYWEDLFAFEDGVFAWDEAHVDADSRMFAQNVEATSWFLQTRKSGLDLLMTTQSFDQVDLRIRNMVDCVIELQKISPGVSRSTTVDGYSGRIIRRGVFRHNPQLYALYDTRAKVDKLHRRSKTSWQDVKKNERGGA